MILTKMNSNILYFTALAAVILQIFGFSGLILAVLLTMIISLINRMDYIKRTEESKEYANSRLAEIADTVNSIAQQVNELRANVEKNVFSLENRITEVKTDYRIEMESQYRDLVKKIIDVENRLIDIRKTVGAAFGTLEDRLESR